MPVLLAVGGGAVGAVFGLDVNIIPIDQRDLVVHYQIAAGVRIGLHGVYVEIVEDVRQEVIDRLPGNPREELRMLRIESPLRPRRGRGWHQRLRAGTQRCKGKNTCNKAQVWEIFTLTDCSHFVTTS